MFTELYIAKRLQIGNGGEGKRQSPSLTIATLGIVLAITIMILSLTIVGGFKNEIASKIYSLDSHIKVSNAAVGLDDNIYTIDGNEVFSEINNSPIAESIAGMSLIAQQSAILKTAADFKGIIFKGVDANFDWAYLQESLVEGSLPNQEKINEVIVSLKVANKLHLKVGDAIFTYFFDNKVKARKITIVGVFNTDLDDFDENFILGNIAFLQNVNRWTASQGNYVGINLKNTAEIPGVAYKLYSSLASGSYNSNSNTIYNVTNTTVYNASYFSWLSLLNMNVAIIIILMALVSGFTLISALLMIVLERIKMIGLLKTMGATNAAIRNIFICLTQKIILRSVLLGNIMGLGLSFLQQHFKLVALAPEAYYMPYVPIEFNWTAIIVLNCSIVVIAYLTLIGPSHIISGIKPSTTMRYE